MPKFSDTRKYFELMVSRKGISQLSKNAAANPRSGYRPAKNIKPRGPWNDTVHGILVYNGEVRDVYARWNGSFFRRNAGRNSWKVRLPRYNQFNGQSDLLLMDKDNVTVAAHTLYRELGLPTSHTEWVDVAINKRKMRRLMIEDHNDRMLENTTRIRPDETPEPSLNPTGISSSPAASCKIAARTAAAMAANWAPTTAGRDCSVTSGFTPLRIRTGRVTPSLRK